MSLKAIILKYYAEITIALIALSSSLFLMFSTFSVADNKLVIATKAWSDFASHIPLIRSFSFGLNFPPQYPLFPGEPIKYHFLFYSLVGFLEKIGLRIDLALNILSAVGFAGLVIMIYLLAKELFKSKEVGLISAVFLLFNSSFSFIYFFKNHPLSNQTLNQLISLRDFQSFAPYGSGLVSAFWNLNIYTNQRHLGLSFALSLGLIYLLIRSLNKKIKLTLLSSFFLGVIMGLCFYLHVAVFLMTAVVLAGFFVLFPQLRKNILAILIPAAIIAFPQYLYLRSGGGYEMHLVFGYLVFNKLNLFNFVQFWIYNLGVSLVLIPLGFLFASKQQKMIILAFCLVFVLGNVIQFSPEIAANHKFFNYFLLVGNIFSAFALFRLWNKKLILRPLVAVLFFFMILGGIIDLFPILNDSKIIISDYRIDQRASWILKNTAKNSTFLNTSFLYDPASLAGRKIYLGWPYFAWSQGYDTNKRGAELAKILGAKDKAAACQLAKENNLDYAEIQIQNPPDPNLPPISNVWSTFKPSFQSDNYSIYEIKNNCR